MGIKNQFRTHGLSDSWEESCGKCKPDVLFQQPACANCQTSRLFWRKFIVGILLYFLFVRQTVLLQDLLPTTPPPPPTHTQLQFLLSNFRVYIFHYGFFGTFIQLFKNVNTFSGILVSSISNTVLIKTWQCVWGKGKTSESLNRKPNDATESSKRLRSCLGRVPRKPEGEKFFPGSLLQTLTTREA